MGRAWNVSSKEQQVLSANPTLFLEDSVHFGSLAVYMMRPPRYSIGHVCSVGSQHSMVHIVNVQFCAEVCRKNTRHYERPSLHWTPPTTSELAAAQTLEELMRQQLSSIASFNETERMVLLKQFQVQERFARSQARRLHNANACPPSGLLSVDQFIAAWHNLSVKVRIVTTVSHV